MGSEDQFEKKVIWTNKENNIIVYEHTETFDSLPDDIRAKSSCVFYRQNSLKDGEEASDYKKHNDFSSNEQHKNQKKEKLLSEFGVFHWVRAHTQKGLFMDGCNPALLARAFYIGLHNRKFDDFDYRKIGVKGSRSQVMSGIADTGLFDGDPSPETFKSDIMWLWQIGKVYDGRAGKLFDRQYKSAIETTSPKKHVYIGRILQLLPYVNHFSNVLCRQDQVNSTICTDYLNISDISSLFCIKKTNSYRFVENMCSLTFIRRGRPEPILYEARDANANVLCVNPHFYYAADLLRGDHICVPKMY